MIKPSKYGIGLDVRVRTFSGDLQCGVIRDYDDHLLTLEIDEIEKPLVDIRIDRIESVQYAN